MTNEVRTKRPYVYGVGADALYQVNMVECDHAFQIRRSGKAPGILFESFILSTYEITMASGGVACRMQMREEKRQRLPYKDDVAALSEALYSKAISIH